MKKMYGVITAMTTPFTKDGNVDTNAIKEHIEFLIEKGIDCIYPCGTTGEMLNMSLEERELVAETVVKAVAGRVVVYIHAGAQTTAQTIRLAQHARKIGADGIGVVTPPFFGLSDKAIVQYYKDVAASVPANFPIYVYVIPQCAANDITAPVMEEIADACPNVIGVKYSWADCIRLKDYLNVRNGNFSVLFGPDRLFLPALAMGCDGTVSGCSGPMPEHFVRIYDAWKKGDLEEARKEQKIANEICEIMKSGADMGIFKAVLDFRGLTGGYMRKPLLDLNEKEREALKNEIMPYLP
ncbi:MAG: dihydrodipicolinate synthase family protein [Clostridiales bacterium]|nr:dihydrodipicolinate synthase family protein [Clostridiales bacterium]